MEHLGDEFENHHLATRRLGCIDQMVSRFKQSYSLLVNDKISCAYLLPISI